MSRQERRNMIEYINKKRELSTEKLIYMTDEEIEHIYNITYFHYEQIIEG
ncbi:BH0509 family protein [Bacillus sp. Marseille-P3661]|nr:BH0509 family protein [Bacillus sp. Marseille-P3661]